MDNYGMLDKNVHSGSMPLSLQDQELFDNFDETLMGMSPSEMTFVRPTSPKLEHSRIFNSSGLSAAQAGAFRTTSVRSSTMIYNSMDHREPMAL